MKHICIVFSNLPKTKKKGRRSLALKLLKKYVKMLKKNEPISEHKYAQKKKKKIFIIGKKSQMSQVNRLKISTLKSYVGQRTVARTRGENGAHISSPRSLCFRQQVGEEQYCGTLVHTEREGNFSGVISFTKNKGGGKNLENKTRKFWKINKKGTQREGLFYLPGVFRTTTEATRST